MTESKLRQLVRETLLAESAIKPKASFDMGIFFTVYKSGNTQEVLASKGEDQVGQLTAERIELPCSEAWNITWASAQRGLGPLMYDLMMDAIFPHPLTADRSTVSSDAWKVWNFYLNNRPDIEVIQLDDPGNTITPNEDDNCFQTSALLWSKYEGGSWQDSPLSKAYRRKDGKRPTLNALRRLGNLELAGQ